MPTFRPLQLKKPLKAVVPWKPEEFRRQVFARGQEVQWEMNAQCPCTQFVVSDDADLNEPLGHPKPDCPECRGTGRLYHSKQNIVAMVEDLSRNPKTMRMFGEMAFGGASFSVLPENRPGYFDRLTLLRSVMPYSEVRVRQATTESMNYPIVSRSVIIGQEGDPTEPETVNVNVLYVRKTNSVGDLQPTPIVEGTDFNVVDGNIVWVDGTNAPEPGTFYTIQYYAHPAFVVKDFPYVVRDQYVKDNTPDAVFTQMESRVFAWLEVLGNGSWAVS